MTITARGGRSAQLTGRDEDVLLDLYLVDWATTDQLARWHFPTNVVKRAYNRLRELRNKGLLVTRVSPVDGRGLGAKLCFWALSREARADRRAILRARGVTTERLFAEPPNEAGRSRQTNPEFAGLEPFEISVAYHLKSVSDLYADLKGPLLVSYGGPGEGWIWRNERRAYVPWGDTGAHHFRPDAELVLDYPDDPAAPGEPERFHLFFEVQTARSKRSERELARRINNHYLATQIAGFPDQGSRLLVFLGESPSHVRVARETADGLGLPNLCGHKEATLPVLRDAISSVASGRSPLRPAAAPTPSGPRLRPPGPA